MRKVVRRWSILFKLSPSKKQLPDSSSCERMALPEEVNDGKV
jgi:hypothetical protein